MTPARLPPPPPPDSVTAPERRRPSFRARYDDLEVRRTQLIARLRTLDAKARASPSCARAATLLNATFRKSKLVQRAAVLQAAQWLIDLAERFSAMG